MHRAFHGATLTGALVLVTLACPCQSWAQDQGRLPAPPALVGRGLPEAPPEQVGMSKQKLARIHDVLKQHVADGRLPGTVVLVARKGKLVYADVTGFQDKDEGKPMALDSVFRIYSMTKPLVSVAAMMLVEDGTIELTDPVSKFFPSFKGQQVSIARSDNELARISYVSVAAEREMTVQDLLRHTGLPTARSRPTHRYGMPMPRQDSISRAFAITTRATSPRQTRWSGSPRRRSRISRARSGNTAWRSTCSAAWWRPLPASGSRTFSTSVCCGP